MKTIGLIGGMSCESTITYYQIINKVIKDNLGGLHSGKIILYSVDFYEIEKCQINNDWTKSAKILSEISKNLENVGADFILICTNTMHKVVPNIQKNINIPIVHIADTTAEKLLEDDIKKVALLGTKYTMKEDFYKNRIVSKNIEVLVPNDNDIEVINSIIYDELCSGFIFNKSKEKFIKIIEKLKYRGAEGVILGCTEIGLLLSQKDLDIPIYDTAEIHAIKGVNLALETS